jgi:DNA-binding XRE family transcriptional regulator
MRDWRAVFGKNVRRYRQQKKLTQEELAFEAEIDLTYMGAIERGRRNPSFAWPITPSFESKADITLKQVFMGAATATCASTCVRLRPGTLARVFRHFLAGAKAQSGSAIVTKRTSRSRLPMSAFGGKADIDRTQRNVCL